MENDIKELSGVKVHCAFEKAVDLVDLVEHPRNPNKTSIVRVKNRYLEKAIIPSLWIIGSMKMWDPLFSMPIRTEIWTCTW